ncbi:hypothetical protein NESM_000647700 [Novymonas esmeraldas]|uniref:Uncharacterized protein n=1 Tax=Novymonas esmeraldas TaxID=1808958 RepID=A0AAW0ESC3_9TRYP
MGYGGPRVEFFTANHYSNYASAIDRENAARVRSIVQRRQWPAEREAQRQREEEFRAYEQAQADEVARVHAEEAAALERRRIADERALHRLATKTRRSSLTAAEVTVRRARHAHLSRLAVPRQHHEAMYGAGMMGSAMPHQSGRNGALPTVGRNGAVYCAGVDRDRIVPPRPVMQGTTPPWVGSYSTHHGPHELEAQVAREEAAYYCANPAPQRSASEQAARQHTLHSIAAAHAAQQPDSGACSVDTMGEDDDAGVAETEPRRTAAPDDDAASVFSHGSSNGPIAATGNKHLSTSSTKDSVRLHLSCYGGAMTAPRPPRPPKTLASESLTLPALADRLVRMQMPSPAAH